MVSASGWHSLPQELREELSAELNVQRIEPVEAAGDDMVDVSAKANFRALGKRFGKQTPEVAAAIAATDPHLLQQSLSLAGRAQVEVNGETVTIEPDEVVITETPREGWAVHHDAGESIALDLTVTPELRRLGLARDVVRQVQEARKVTGLDVSDRISLRWTATGDVRGAIVEQAASIADEVLATSMTETESLDPHDPGVHSDAETGLLFTVSKATPG